MLSPRRTELSVAGVLGLGLLWAYWPVLGNVAHRWSVDPKYSHGYLVPVFSLWLLVDRLRKSSSAIQGSWVGSWWGLVILVPAIALHLAGAYVFFDWMSELSFLFSLAGLCICLGGRGLLIAAGPSIAFLVFMLPLPYRLEVALGQPLQRLATQASTYLLQMLGFYASDEGNIVVLNSGMLGVVEACSGLGMLVTFLALATAVAICLKRPLLDRIVVVASALPVAIISNVIRITVTGALYEVVGGRAAQFIYHDIAGWFMMPLALSLIWFELQILSRLLVVPPAKDKTALSLNLGVAAPLNAGKRKKKVATGT